MIGDFYCNTRDEDDTDSVIIEKIKDKSEIIKEMWAKSKRGRKVIDKLNEFKEIADLTPPDWDASIAFLVNLRRLAKLYSLNAWSECEQGDPQIAAGEIIKFDSVVRKLSVTSRSLITKLACYSYLSMDIRTANFIINNPSTSQETVKLLAEHFGCIQTRLCFSTEWFYKHHCQHLPIVQLKKA